MPKLLHRQVFTHRGIYTKVLHTDAADASTHRSFWTQMPFHAEAFTQRGFDIYTPMHTEAFRHRWFFRESQKLWHREAFTQRIFYTQKLLHTQAFPQKLLHREAFEHELLHTDAKGLGRALPNLHFATCLDVRPARSLSPQTVAAGPRTNKTRISPHVWVSDTPQRVTFRKPPPGCRCRQREIEELEKSDFAGVHIQFDHWKLAELLCSNSCATISVQMTLQAGLL